MSYVKIAVVKSLLYFGGGGSVNEFVSVPFKHMLSDFGEIQYKGSVAVEQG